MYQQHQINSRARKTVVKSALLAATAMAIMPLSAHAQDAEGANGVQDIVVTAQRREQSMQDVPISISALDQNTLKANRIQDIRDLNAIAPNLTVRQSAGGSSQAIFTMRGIVTGGVAAGSDKGISMYLDGVYLQPTQGSVFELADIERIEVLKGPQGTLFGRNSDAGAISVWTHNPTGQLAVHQEFTYGNLDQFRSKSQVDLPKFGPLSISATYLHSQQHGAMQNLGGGTVWTFGGTNTFTSPTRLGDKNLNSIAAAVKFDLDPNLDLMYKFDWTDSKYTPEGLGLALLTGSLAATYPLSPGQLTPISLLRPNAVNNAFESVAHLRNSGHNLTAAYHLTDHIVLKNILAFRESRVSGGKSQLDGMGGYYLSGRPFAALIAGGGNFQRQWGDEFQVIIDNQWFNFTAGVLHFQDKQDTSGDTPGIPNTYSAISFTGAGTAASPYVLPLANGYLPTHVKSISNAAYMQMELYLSDKLHVVGGARITSDHKSGIEYAWTQPRSTNGFTNATTSGPIFYKGSKATYLAGVNYYPTRDIMAYAKYSTGYVSGGQLANIDYLPETASSWEAGLKTELFDRKLRSNLAVFDVKYHNIQATTSGLATGVPAAAPFAVAVVSVADAKAYGFEWENTLIPVEGVTLTGNVGYTHFAYDQNTLYPPLASVAGAPGYQVAGRPKWTANFAAEYDSPEVIGGGHFVLRADTNYRSSSLLSATLTTGSTPTSPADPRVIAAATVPPTWIVNGRIALQDVNFGAGKASLALWGRNLFNNRAINNYSQITLGALGTFASVIYERARTFGADLSVDF